MLGLLLQFGILWRCELYLSLIKLELRKLGKKIGLCVVMVFELACARLNRSQRGFCRLKVREYPKLIQLLLFLLLRSRERRKGSVDVKQGLIHLLHLIIDMVMRLGGRTRGMSSTTSGSEEDSDSALDDEDVDALIDVAYTSSESGPSFPAPSTAETR